MQVEEASEALTLDDEVLDHALASLVADGRAELQGDGPLGGVYTVAELEREGPLAGADPRLVRAALAALEDADKCEVFTGATSADAGVKFFRDDAGG